MLLKTTMYLDLHIFHMRDHKDRGGLETGNLRKQFKNYEKFAVIFQIRKQQEIRKTRFLRRIFVRISFSNFWFLSLLLARSRRVLANLEERIQKFIDAAFFWPVENVREMSATDPSGEP